jgi:ribosomal protein S18 acetylase RimI-like enzyme
VTVDGVGREAVTIDIRPALFPAEREVVRELFREYADSLGIDLCFQGFDEELATLPGSYAEPRGRLLIATREARVLGCVALRPIDERTGEMKRLYVRPAARGERLGRRLAERICDEARSAGYARILLDTLPAMDAAQALYRSLAFEPVAPYVFNPIEGVEYLGLNLSHEGPNIDRAPR